MKPKKDVRGEVYGRLTITGDAPYRTRDRRVFVLCECGKTKDVLLGDLRRGDTLSCGCYLKERITSHGDSYTRLYKIYAGMLSRCHNPAADRYASYGARGISVCESWKNSYEEFRDWALRQGYDDSLTIERKDVDGNYEPDNCTWLPQALQQRNKQRLTSGSSTYIGVSHCKQTGRWIAMIKVHGKQKNLGRYASELEAAKARDQYIIDSGLTNFHMNKVLP